MRIKKTWRPRLPDKAEIAGMKDTMRVYARITLADIMIIIMITLADIMIMIMIMITLADILIMIMITLADIMIIIIIMITLADIIIIIHSDAFRKNIAGVTTNGDFL